MKRATCQERHPWGNERLLFATACVATATVVVGCGAGSSSPGTTGDGASGSPDSQVLAAAYTATTGAQTARVQIRTTTQAQSAGASLNSTSTTEGVLNLGNGDRDMTTQLPTGGQAESRKVGGVLYSKVPVIGNAPPRPKPWIKVTLTGAAANSSSADDPTQALTYLKGAARSITKVGSEQVRGTNTSHYKAEIDLAKLAAEASQSPAPGQPDPGAALRALLGRDTLPVEIWVDNQQRIRRIQTVSPIIRGSASGNASAAPLPSPTASGTATIIQEFYDFGAPVDIQPPPADQIADTPVRVVPGPTPSGTPAPTRTPTPATS